MSGTPKPNQATRPADVRSPEWNYSAEVVVSDGRDFFTDKRIQVGRIVCRPKYGRDCIVLVRRTEDDPDTWEPTWIGPVENAVQVPPGFALSSEALAAMDAASANLGPARVTEGAA